jgi:transposase InsO family protein
MEAWANQYGMQLVFIRPGKAVENSYIESFNGRLPNEYVCGTSRVGSSGSTPPTLSDKSDHYCSNLISSPSFFALSP